MLFFYACKIPRSDIRPYIKWAVGLVVAYGHLNLPHGIVCVCVWVNKLTLSPPRPRVTTQGNTTHLGICEIRHSALVGLNQMITVDGGRDSNTRETTGDELQHSHLCSGVLHGDSVRAQHQVAVATLDCLQQGGLILYDR